MTEREHHGPALIPDEFAAAVRTPAASLRGRHRPNLPRRSRPRKRATPGNALGTRQPASLTFVRFGAKIQAMTLRRTVARGRRRIRCARKGHQFVSQKAPSGDVVEVCVRCGVRGAGHDTFAGSRAR